MTDRTRRLALAAALVSLTPDVTFAHFTLRSPASWRVQDPLGNPQKVGPCGNEGTVATIGAVTAFAPGETITITLDETIFHPGHYRVALAVNDRSELPAEPPVSPGTTACGSAPIMEPPVFPVLADGVLQHTEPFTETRFIQVTLPSDVTCAHCTLQVLEFMSNHGAPCFYHHCADISIGAGGAGCATDGDCDDGNACTRDACSSTQGCITQPTTLADVGTGFLGVLRGSPCSTDELPPRIVTLFHRAETSVIRAAQRRAKANQLLRRASKSLRSASKKLEKERQEGISGECATAVAAVLEEANARVQCLRSGL